MSRVFHARLLDLGRHLASRTRARLLREQVVAVVGSTVEKVTVDLEGVLSLSDSFADEFFGVLAIEQGEEWFRQRVEVVNASESVRYAILRVLANRVAAGPARPTTFELQDPPPELTV